MAVTTLDETVTPEEYDLLVELTERADRLVKDRYKDFNRAVEYAVVVPASDLRGVRYKPRDRAGRDPSGRYDVVVYYRDRYDEGDSSFYLPSSILWDPAAAIGKTLEAIEAERAEQARLEAEAEAERARQADEAERALVARLAKKHGYVKERET